VCEQEFFFGAREFEGNRKTRAENPPRRLCFFPMDTEKESSRAVSPEGGKRVAKKGEGGGVADARRGERVFFCSFDARRRRVGAFGCVPQEGKLFKLSQPRSRPPSSVSTRPRWCTVVVASVGAGHEGGKRRGRAGTREEEAGCHCFEREKRRLLTKGFWRSPGLPLVALSLPKHQGHRGGSKLVLWGW